jgi:hypothetical protein
MGPWAGSSTPQGNPAAKRDPKSAPKQIAPTKKKHKKSRRDKDQRRTPSPARLEQPSVIDSKPKAARFHTSPEATKGAKRGKPAPVPTPGLGAARLEQPSLIDEKPKASSPHTSPEATKGAARGKLAPVPTSGPDDAHPPNRKDPEAVPIPSSGGKTPGKKHKHKKDKKQRHADASEEDQPPSQPPPFQPESFLAYLEQHAYKILCTTGDGTSSLVLVIAVIGEHLLHSESTTTRIAREFLTDEYLKVHPSHARAGLVPG